MIQKISFLLLLSFAVLLVACQKDKDLSTGKNYPEQRLTNNSFKTFDWSEQEKLFFSLDEASLNIAQGRSSALTIFHPLVVQTYNEIATQNEEHSFVDSLVSKLGYPVWSKSYVYYDSLQGKNLVMLPFTRSGANKITGVIASHKEKTGAGNRFIINGYARDELLSNSPEEKDYIAKCACTKWMKKHEKWLFKTEDEALEDTYCSCSESMGPEGNPIDPPTTDPESDCQWRFIEVCTDFNTQVTWIGGRKNIPLHLDHDQDGIYNWEDQDWHELLNRTNISQEDFEGYVLDWWETNYYEEYGDYAEYWSDWADRYDYDFEEYGDHEAYYGDFFEELAEIFEDFWGWFENTFGGDEYPDGFDDLYHWPDPDPWHDCPWDNPIQSETAQTRNEIRCDWYFVLDCGDEEGANWFDKFKEFAPCPGCPGYTEYQDMFRDRLADYRESQSLKIDFYDLYNLISNDGSCDAFSPEFENCVQNIYDNYRNQRILDWIDDNQLGITLQQLGQDAEDCNLSDGFESCLGNAFLEENFSTQEEVIDWLIANNSDLAELNQEMATAPAWMWPIIRELAIEAVAQLIEKQFKIKLASEVIDALRSIGQGDFKSFMITALDIVSQFHPVTKGFSALWDSFSQGKKAISIWNKIKNLADQIGEQAMTRVWNIASSTATKFNEKYLKYVDDLKTPKLGVAPRLDYRKTFKDEFPEVADDIHQVHHAMPQAVYNNYPGILTESELHSLENLRGIPKNDRAFHQTITNRWAQFYLDFPNFTRQDALDFAKQIDDEFGHRFLPPIR